MKDRKVIVVITIIIFMVVLGIVILNGDGISRVKRVLKEDYDSIYCIDDKCSGIYVQKNQKNGSQVKLLDKNGNVIAKYDEKGSKVKEPYFLNKNYFLAKKENSKDNVTYSLNNKKGKQIYKTKNKLESINNKFILMTTPAKIGEKYTILDLNGKEKYGNISTYKSYLDGKYIYIESEENKFILDDKGNKVLEDYKIVEEVSSDDDDVLYLIVKDSNDLNYYYDLSKAKIKGEGFTTYKVNNDKSLIVTRKENDKLVNYNISLDGKKDEKTTSISDTIKNISSKIDEKKYYLYTLSVVSNNQKEVLVDNKSDKSFGILNIETNEFTSLYSYSSDNFYSSISILKSSNNNSYAQISCSSNVCDNTKMLVFDLTNSEELFGIDGSNLVATEYVQYENGYKQVRYSSQTEKEEYKDKYVLYDKDNNEKAINENQMLVIDSNYIMGSVDEKSLLLYLSKDDKFINDEKSLATIIKINNEDYYKYESGSNTFIVNKNGKKLYDIKNDGTLESTRSNVYAIGKNSMRIYTIGSDEVNTYKLLENETLTDSLNNKISPFEDVMFINNNKENYFKVIGKKGNIVKQVKNSQIKSVTINEDIKRAYIVSQKKIDGKVKYGLYIAK